MSKDMSAQVLKDGALLTALSAIMMIVSQFLPGLGFILAMVAGVPISLVLVKHGPAVAGGSALVVTLFLVLMLGPLAGVLVALPVVALALAVGWMLWSHKSAGKTLGVGIMTAVVTRFLFLIFAFGLNGAAMPDSAVLVDQGMAMYEETGMLETMAAQGISESEVRTMLEGMNAFIMKILPAILIVGSAFGAAVHYAVTIRMMKKWRIKIPRLQPFKEWQLPGYFVWGLIVAWALWLGNDYLQLDWLEALAQNILIVYGALLFASGLSVLAHYLALDKLSGGMKLMAVIFLIFFFTGVAIISILAGMFDLVFDFRKLRPGAKDEKKVNKE